MRTSLYKCLCRYLKYNWNNAEERYQYRENLAFKKGLIDSYEAERLSTTLNLGKSAILPGWGHFDTNNVLRGQILLSTEIILAGTSFFLYDKSVEKYDKYKASKQIDEINQYYSDANRLYKQSQLTMGLFAAIWVFNIYDTYVSTNQYNEWLWIRICKRIRSSYKHLSQWD